MTQRLFATTLGVTLTAFLTLAVPALADDAQVARGRYLVTIAGCSDCHTPGALLGSPDMKRYLGGSDVGFAIPGAGVFVGQNLTADKETGLGKWTDSQIIAALRTGKTPEGRELSPVMPYPALSHLSDADAQAIVAFLRSLTPVTNQVKNFGPNDKVTINVSAVLPPDVFNALPAPKK
jgi:mono/diheme cytochrome c family protein